MSRRIRALSLAVVVTLIGCGTSISPTPSAPGSSASPVTASQPPATSSSATPGPSSATPASPTPALITPGPATASSPPTGAAPATPITQPTLPSGQTPSPTGCPPFPTVSGPWPSDRLVAVDVGSDGGQDRVIFRFGPPSRPGVTSRVTIRKVTGPFTAAGSGQPVQVAGSMFTSFRAEGLQLVDAKGLPTYPGETDMRPNLPVMKQFVAIDESEGVMEWIIGTNEACVALDTQPGAGTIAIAYGHALP